MSKPSFFIQYEQKFSFDMPVFLIEALKVNGLDSLSSLGNIEDFSLEGVLEEIRLQIIRFALNASKISNEATESAFTHMKDLCHTDYKEYVMPSTIKSFLLNMISDCRHKIQKTCSGCNVHCVNFSSSSVSQRISITCEEYEALPWLLQLLIRNARTNSVGNKRNHYEDYLKDIASFVFIKGGGELYDLFQKNLAFPEISTIRKYLHDSSLRLEENELYYDELKNYLEKNNYDMEIGIFEDGTRIVNTVEYCAKSNTLSGLSMGINPKTGMPMAPPEASTAKAIIDAFSKYDKSTTVQILLAVPNAPHCQPFFLGMYSTNNKFKAIDVANKIQTIKKELEYRGIKLLMYGTDGDTKFICAQKKLANFGNLTNYLGVTLAGNSFELEKRKQFFFSQDPYHIAKKIKNQMFDPANNLTLGKFHVTRSHLVVMAKKYPPIQHGLNKSDLDFRNLMNYKNIHKVISDKVIHLLENMPGTEGTVSYLKLIKRFLEAYFNKETSVKDRLTKATYCTYFLRNWRQDLENRFGKRDAEKKFVSSNVFEGCELNFIMLLSLAKESKVDNIVEFSSQQCESYFRRLRSYTTTESTMVNFTMKNLISRLLKINYVEDMMFNLKQSMHFRKNPNYDPSLRKCTTLSDAEIEECLAKGVCDANLDSVLLGIRCEEVKLELFIKPVSTFELDNESEDEIEDESGNESETPLATEFDSENEDSHTEYAGLLFSDQPTCSNRLEIADAGTSGQMTKSQLVRSLQTDRTYISSDKHSRFITRKPFQVTPLSTHQDAFWQSQSVTIGDYVVLKSKNDFFFGQILNIRHLNEEKKSKVAVQADSISTCKKNQFNPNIGVLLDPIFKIGRNDLQPITATNEYISMGGYKCNAKENVDFSSTTSKVLLKKFIK